MPRIRGASIEQHHEMVWADLARALRELLLERNYDAITMGHIATRAGLVRNTLYNYAPDKPALVLAVTQRLALPTFERVAVIAARTAESDADQVREIIAVVLEAFTDPVLRPMFRPGSGSPFSAIVVEVENVVRAGVAGGEFRDVGDVRLTVELLSRAMRAGAERISRDPSLLAATRGAARDVVLAALTSPSDRPAS